MAKFVFAPPTVKTQQFVNASTIEVSHELSYDPLIYIIVDGQMCFGDVSYSGQQFTVTLASTMSGVIYYI